MAQKSPLKVKNPAPRSLSESAFQKLSRQLSAILTNAEAASNEEKTAGYWNAGARIQAVRLSEEAGYHNAILRELADDVGVSVRTLQHAVRLHAAYDSPPPGPLSWAHYRLIAPLRTQKERDFYQKHALADGCTARDLAAAIRSDLFGGGTLESAKIERPTSPAYVYLAESPLLIDADTLDIDIDLGFQTWTHRRIRLARIDCPESGSKKGRAARNFVHKHLARTQTIVIKSEKVDLHGRYIGDIFLSPHKVSIDECYHQGLYLNAAIIAAGHGVII